MQTIILVGGQGTRLWPYTATLPKPLVPVGDRPILDIVLRQLRRAGAGEIILSTGHFAELIQSYFGDGGKWGLTLRYAREDTPLGTAGPLAAIDGLDENFLVMNGDLLTQLDFRELWTRHVTSGAAATLAVTERSVPIDFGVVQVDAEHRLAGYVEKPTLRYTVSMGINALNRRCLKHVERGEALSMPDLLLRLKRAGERVDCWVNDSQWLDIGRPEDYQTAQERFTKDRRAYLPDE
jgi:NDP-sugar pyrophosphorylase family protein